MYILKYNSLNPKDQVPKKKQKITLQIGQKLLGSISPQVLDPMLPKKAFLW